jgi:iron complex outermembrane receptor protein
MPLKNIENPQVYSTVSSQLLKEQVVTNYEDALKNVPGIFKLWETTGRGGDGGAYYSLRGFEAQSTIINGMPGLTNGSLDPANIEKIEVIKGPSGTLFGSTIVSYGGLINTVTKKPRARRFRRRLFMLNPFGIWSALFRIMLR